MKTAILISGLLLTVVFFCVAEDTWTIVPVKPTFSWKKDAQNIPQERDPMTPVDFVWPRPEKGTTNIEPIKATGNKAQLSLTVEFISYTATERFAKVTGFVEFLEEGKEYSFTAKGYKVMFKVEKIEPTKLTVNYEGEILEFAPKAISEELKGKTF